VKFLTGFILAFMIVCHLAQGGTNQWATIVDLIKDRSPEGSAKYTAYMKSLTPEQMLQAAREACEMATTTETPERAAMGSLYYVPIALRFYGSPTGELTEQRLRLVLECIGNERESSLFRERLMTQLESYYNIHLTYDQRTECVRLFSTVSANPETPRSVRAMCCTAWMSLLTHDYIHLLNLDSNVRKANRDWYESAYRNLVSTAGRDVEISLPADELIQTGDLALDPATLQALEPYRKELEQAKTQIGRLASDTNNPPELRRQVESAFQHLVDLPEPPSAAVLAARAKSHWSQIHELLKQGGGKESPELAAYLKGLTPVETVEAVRERCDFIIRTLPDKPSQRADMGGIDTRISAAASYFVPFVLAAYENPPGAGLSEERFKLLLKPIADEGESVLFRETLLRRLTKDYWARLTPDQRQECLWACAAVVASGKAQDSLQAMCCRQWYEALSISRTAESLDEKKRADEMWDRIELLKPRLVELTSSTNHSQWLLREAKLLQNTLQYPPRVLKQGPENRVKGVTLRYEPE